MKSYDEGGRLDQFDIMEECNKEKDGEVAGFQRSKMTGNGKFGRRKERIEKPERRRRRKSDVDEGERMKC